MNVCVVHICAGEFEQARQRFDEVLLELNLKEITAESDYQNMLPAYLVSLLTYFYLRTKNLKMARALVKSRRFVIDTDHIVQ